MQGSYDHHVPAATARDFDHTYPGRMGWAPDSCSKEEQEGIYMVAGTDYQLPSTVTYMLTKPGNCMLCGTEQPVDAVVHEDLVMICNHCAKRLDGVIVHTTYRGTPEAMERALQSIHTLWFKPHYMRQIDCTVEAELLQLVYANLYDASVPRIS